MPKSWPKRAAEPTPAAKPPAKLPAQFVSAYGAVRLTARSRLLFVSLTKSREGLSVSSARPKGAVRRPDMPADETAPMTPDPATVVVSPVATAMRRMYPSALSAT
jgi:hypothetical protein